MCTTIYKWSLVGEQLETSWFHFRKKFQTQTHISCHFVSILFLKKKKTFDSVSRCCQLPFDYCFHLKIMSQPIRSFQNGKNLLLLLLQLQWRKWRCWNEKKIKTKEQSQKLAFHCCCCCFFNHSFTHSIHLFILYVLFEILYVSKLFQSSLESRKEFEIQF